MRQINTLILTLSALLTACDYNSPEDYNARAEYTEFLALQEAKKAKAAEEAKDVDPGSKLKKARKCSHLLCHLPRCRR